MAKTYRQQLEGWLNNIPDLYHGKFRKQWLRAVTRGSMKAAVDAKCADCTCWQNTEIDACPVITCPLWQYRPKFSGEDGNERRRTVLGVANALRAEFAPSLHGECKPEF